MVKSREHNVHRSWTCSRGIILTAVVVFALFGIYVSVVRAEGSITATNPPDGVVLESLDSLNFIWNASGVSNFKVLVSANPRFPSGRKTVKISPRKDRPFAALKRGAVRRLNHSLEINAGIVFWKVIGKEEKTKRRLASKTMSIRLAQSDGVELLAPLDGINLTAPTEINFSWAATTIEKVTVQISSSTAFPPGKSTYVLKPKKGQNNEPTHKYEILAN